MTVCRKNLYHTQELQKQTHNKGVMPSSYVFGDKVWLNSKYLKTIQRRKLVAKFFGPFRVLYLLGKQAYKLKLSKKWKINNIFQMSLLEQDNIIKEGVEKVPELDRGDENSKKYEVEAIQDKAVYGRESEGHVSGLY